MGLFGKKKEVEHCAICGKEKKGGLLRGLFQESVGGQYVCNDCYGDVDISPAILNTMSIDAFKNYLIFREENAKLKEHFQATRIMDLGMLNKKIIFDRKNGYVSFDKSLEKTIFERKHITSFEIREDDQMIFQGNADGLHTYESTVAAKIDAMGPEFERFNHEHRLFDEQFRHMNETQQAEECDNEPRFKTEEPFRQFVVNICFDHLYWDQMTFEMGAPKFNEIKPDGDAYLAEYRRGYKIMEELSNEIMAFAFVDRINELANEE